MLIVLVNCMSSGMQNINTLNLKSIKNEVINIMTEVKNQGWQLQVTFKVRVD